MGDRKNKVTDIWSELKKLFSNQLWGVNVSGLSAARRRIIKFIKLTRITFSEFATNDMGMKCVALSYYVVMAVIPFAALVLAVSGGIGISDKLSAFVYEYIPADQKFLATILEKADVIINTVQSGGVGIVGGIALLWTILRLMFQVENVFNSVWKVKKIPRKLVKRFGFYFGAIVLSPFVLFIFGAGIVLYTDMTKLINISIPVHELSNFKTFLGWLVFYGISGIIMAVMYKFIPAVKIKFRSALVAAAVTGIFFAAFQFLYLKTQIFVTRTNAVYGVIAAIPLFFMWVNYSWQIIIYGAHLCYGVEKVDTYNIPEGSLKDFTPYFDRRREEILVDKVIMEDDEK